MSLPGGSKKHIGSKTKLVAFKELKIVESLGVPLPSQEDNNIAAKFNLDSKLCHIMYVTTLVNDSSINFKVKCALTDRAYE